MNKNGKLIKVVQLQYSTESGGSAALRLQNAFLNEGIESTIISLITDDISGIQNIKYLGKKAVFTAKIDNRLQAQILKKSIKSFGLFSFPVLGSNVADLTEVKNADYIYVHWALNGFLNHNSIEKLAKLNKPVIFFMHDMWSFTGGCHYSFECDKYKTGCSNCQMFSIEQAADLAKKGFEKKVKLYAKYNNLFYIAPSQWLTNCAKNSMLLKNKPVLHIPNLLDNTIYKPFNKQAAKQALNIGKDEIVVAFGAVTIKSPYKGWVYLQKALEFLKQDKQYQNVTVLMFGSGYDKQIADAIPFKTIFLGYLRDEYSTVLAYNAANVFIAPSLVEAFGYVIMESLYCGTPVVGFEVGGIPDMVKHKENGYIAKYKDAEDVCTGIKFCLANNLQGYMHEGFEPSVTIKKHLELFEQTK
jgi:glycosyltransferase involved in cell wall biosynthesis